MTARDRRCHCMCSARSASALWERPAAAAAGWSVPAGPALAALRDDEEAASRVAGANATAVAALREVAVPMSVAAEAEDAALAAFQSASRRACNARTWGGGRLVRGSLLGRPIHDIRGTATGFPAGSTDGMCPRFSLDNSGRETRCSGRTGSRHNVRTGDCRCPTRTTRRLIAATCYTL